MYILIILLAITVLALIFTLQNVVKISVTFLFWRFEGSLPLILLLIFVAGVVIGLFIISPAVIKSKLTIMGQKKELKELKKKAGAVEGNIGDKKEGNG